VQKVCGEFQCKATASASPETQGQLVGAGKSLAGEKKNSGKEKSRRRIILAR